MLGREVLDAAPHPRIGLSSVAVDCELPVLDPTLALILHGRPR